VRHGVQVGRASNIKDQALIRPSRVRFGRPQEGGRKLSALDRRAPRTLLPDSHPPGSTELAELQIEVQFLNFRSTTEVEPTVVLTGRAPPGRCRQPGARADGFTDDALPRIRQRISSVRFRRRLSQLRWDTVNALGPVTVPEPYVGALLELLVDPHFACELQRNRLGVYRLNGPEREIHLLCVGPAVEGSRGVTVEETRYGLDIEDMTMGFAPDLVVAGELVVARVVGVRSSVRDFDALPRRQGAAAAFNFIDADEHAAQGRAIRRRGNNPLNAEGLLHSRIGDSPIGAGPCFEGKSYTGE